MIVEEILLSFALSWLANKGSDLLNKNPTVNQRIKSCYKKALKKWCANCAIRKRKENKYNSIEKLRSYIQSSSFPNDSEEEKLFELWIEELRNDELCYDYILENKLKWISIKLDNNFEKIRDILSDKLQKQIKSFYEASTSLRSCNSTIGNNYHIERKETEELYDWIKSEKRADKKDRIMTLLGNAGTGKSVILHDLLLKLENDNIKVLALKSDQLFDKSDSDLDNRVGLGISVVQALKQASEKELVVLLIDQIDALSSMLSLNRTPLTAMINLINNASDFENVKIVLSCRKYEYDFDASFGRYHEYETKEVGNLEESEVVNALKSIKTVNVQLTDSQTNFLRNPLYLYLYCRIRDKRLIKSTFSLTSLYNALWDEIIIRRIDNKIETSTDELVDFLWELTSKMVDKQVLSVNSATMGTKYNKEQAYLISNGIIAYNELMKEIQFSHQTLFDYIYARMFFEEGCTLESVFENAHQGLYMHLRLKQVLEYQRFADHDDYIKNLHIILNGVDENGKSKYRFQLKHLIITTLAYQTELSEQEKCFIKNSIFSNNEFTKIYLSSANTKCSFEFVQSYIKNYASFIIDETSFKHGILLIANHICHVEPLIVVQYINTLSFNQMDDENLAIVKRIINMMQPTNDILPITTQILKEIDLPEKMDFYEYYKNLLKIKPLLVAQRLKKHIVSLLKNSKSNGSHELEASFEIKVLINEFYKCNKIEFFNFAICILQYLSSKSVFPNNCDIKNSYEFFLFNRQNNPYKTGDELLQKVLNTVEERVEADNISHEDLKRLASSEYAICHIIAIVGWLKNIDKFKNDICQYFEDNMLKSRMSSSLEYYMKELFGAVFMNLPETKQQSLIDIVDKLDPVWEHKHSKHKPFTNIGYTKGQYFHKIPEDYLKVKFHKQWKDYSEAKRKFYNLDNIEPNKITFQAGWTKMSPRAYKYMNEKEIIHSMKKYDSDKTFAFNKPTKTGNAMAFKEKAKENPTEYFNVYKRILQEKLNVDVVYVLYGIEGLLEAKYETNKINVLIESLISNFDKDINKYPEENIIFIVRLVEKYKDSEIPDPLFDFICRVAEHRVDNEDQYKLDDEKSEIKHTISINDGINQARGAAVFNLMSFISDEKKRNKVFQILESIAPTASVATRCAALFRLALLIKYDRERTLKLFLSLTHDYDPNLLNMPLHDLNPLVYLYKTNFQELIPYFEECLKYPQCYSVNVTVLLMAWLKDKNESEKLLFKMADCSETAITQLIRDIETYYDSQYENKLIQILLKYKDSDNENIGKTYDVIFKLYKRMNCHSFIDVFDKLVNASICQYFNKEFYSFLKDFVEDNPIKCLEWLKKVYDRKIEAQFNDFYEMSTITEILLSAYNTIRIFNKTDPILENAMDMLDTLLLDTLLMKNGGIQKLEQCLYEIAN